MIYEAAEANVRIIIIISLKWGCGSVRCQYMANFALVRHIDQWRQIAIGKTEEAGKEQTEGVKWVERG